MGFRKREHKAGNYASIARGHFTIRCDEDTPDAVERVLGPNAGDRAGDTIWELEFDDIEGHLTDVYVKDSSDKRFKDQLIFVVTDKKTGEVNRIQTSLTGDYARRFFKKMKNIDVSKPILFWPYHMPDKKKKDRYVSGWNFYQGGDDKENKIEDFWDKDEIPEWEEKEVKDGRTWKTVWDSSKEFDFLFGHFEKWQEKVGFGPHKQDSRDEDEPRGRKRRQEEDEPSGRRRRSDDDDPDESPRRRRDDDPEDKPKSRSRNEDDDPPRRRDDSNSDRRERARDADEDRPRSRKDSDDDPPPRSRRAGDDDPPSRRRSGEEDDEPPRRRRSEDSGK